MRDDMFQLGIKTCTKGSVPAAWGLISAEILERQNEPILPELLVQALSTVVDFDFCGIFIYRGTKRPVIMHHTFPGPLIRTALQNYVGGTYVLNPLYRAYQNGLKTGVYRLREIARALQEPVQPLRSFKVIAEPNEEIGFLTEGWPASREELCIVAELPHGACAEISLSRPTRTGFVEDDVSRVEHVTPFVVAALRRYWLTESLSRLNSGENRPVLTARALPSDENDSSSPKLSPREHQVAQLLLAGLSGPAIGRQLGISATTVKTHRRHLYEKLGVQSQRELFARLVAAAPSVRVTPPA